MSKNASELDLPSGRARLLRSAVPPLLVVAGAAVYANSLSGAFVFDDVPVILENESLHDLSDFGRVLSFEQRPIVNLTLAVNYAISGRDPWSYHAFNVLVHLAAGLLLYGVVRRACGWGGVAVNAEAGIRAEVVAGAAALIWLVHPLTTQAVTYVVQRAESMMAMFYLATLYCYFRALSSRRSGAWLAGSVVACIVGMACKGVMVTAPVAVVLIDRTLVTGSVGRALWARGLYYLGLGLSWTGLVLTGVVRGVFFPPEGSPANVGLAIRSFGPVDYLRTQFSVIVHYIRLCFWPDGLCLDYGWPIVRSWSAAVVPATLVLMLLLLSVWGLWGRRWWGLCGVLFFLMLSPTSSVVPIKDAAFEHRMYLPLAMVIVSVVGSAASLARRIEASGRSRRWVNAGAGIVLAAVVGLLGWRTVSRNIDYRDPLRLWLTVVDAAPANARGYLGVGYHLDRRGDHERAVEYLSRAAAMDPEYPEVHYQLGNALRAAGRVDQAVDAFRRAIELRPNYPDALLNLGNVLSALRRADEAIPVYRAAVDSLPDFVEAWTGLGNAHVQLRQRDRAIECFRKVLSLDPRSVDARLNLGAALAEQGDFTEALEHFEAAVALQPGNPQAWFNLGSCHYMLADMGAAAQAFRKTVELDPSDVEARRRLAGALKRLGLTDEATRQIDLARQIDAESR